MYRVRNKQDHNLNVQDPCIMHGTNQPAMVLIDNPFVWQLINGRLGLALVVPDYAATGEGPFHHQTLDGVMQPACGLQVRT